MKCKLIAAAVLVFLTATSSANATLILTLQRVSNSVAIVTGTGTTDLAGTQLVLFGASTTGDFGLDGFSGNFAVGGDTLTSVFTRGGTTDFALNFFDTPFGAGESISGASTLTLDVESWAPVGTTGTVRAEGIDFGDTGRYRIVGAAVPEPGALALFGLGLAGLGFMRLRRRFPE